MMQGYPDSFSTHILTGLLRPKPGMGLAQAPTHHLCHTGTQMGKWVQGQIVPLLEALAVQFIYRSTTKEQISAAPAAHSSPLTFTVLPYCLQALSPSSCSKHWLGPDCQHHQLRQVTRLEEHNFRHISTVLCITLQG